MKHIATIAVLTCLFLLTGCQTDTEVSQRNSKSANLTSSPNVTDRIVDVSCGQCQFGMEGTGCDLAVRIDGKSYYVDGSSIDDHGDAHGDDGLCNCIRKAKVTGAIKDGRFLATSLSVLSSEE